jgi:hypothetical protein
MPARRTPTQQSTFLDPNTWPPSYQHDHQNCYLYWKRIGDLLSVDDTSGAITTFKSYLRIVVEIEANNPLKPGFSFSRDGGESMWIFLKYERLDIYCYSCGRLNHKSANCMVEPKERTHVRYAVSLKLNIFSNLLPSSPSSNTNPTINTSQTQPSNPHSSAMGLNQLKRIWISS